MVYTHASRPWVLNSHLLLGPTLLRQLLLLLAFLSVLARLLGRRWFLFAWGWVICKLPPPHFTIIQPPLPQTVAVLREGRREEVTETQCWCISCSAVWWWLNPHLTGFPLLVAFGTLPTVRDLIVYNTFCFTHLSGDTHTSLQCVHCTVNHLTFLTHTLKWWTLVWGLSWFKLYSEFITD